ncbi:MAG: YidC/Oxa1 family membrane protein insertase, partial [Actinomycetota bacterium]|nr:YidC/Oxa1 family membrane protein insertase [Actinomycetota bacterium]
NPFTILAPPMGRILAFLYDIWPNNYGVAIIFLTLLVSLLLFPLTLKQTRSMKAMQEIQPEVKKLQKELKGDKEELNKQMMALYQERGVNPAAGCLPLIVQMPIWFALFRVLRVGPSSSDPTVLDPDDIIPVDSNLADALLDHNTDFLGMDMLQSPQEATSAGLATAIPAIILIIIVVATGFYQGYQTTKKRKNNGDQQESKQAQQMQTVMKIMPLFMGFISWGFPTGLVLYFAVSNLFRIGQQAVIFRLDGDDGATSKPVQETGPPPESPKASSPSPNASKKRNRRRKK